MVESLLRMPDSAVSFNDAEKILKVNFVIAGASGFVNFGNVSSNCDVQCPSFFLLDILPLWCSFDCPDNFQE